MPSSISREAYLGHSMWAELPSQGIYPSEMVYPFEKIDRADVLALRHKLGLIAARIFMKQDIPHIKGSGTIIENPRYDFQASVPETSVFQPIESDERKRALQREEVIGRTRFAVVESLHFESEPDREQEVINLIKCCDEALQKNNEQRKTQQRRRDAPTEHIVTAMDPEQYRTVVQEIRMNRKLKKVRSRRADSK